MQLRHHLVYGSLLPAHFQAGWHPGRHRNGEASIPQSLSRAFGMPKSIGGGFVGIVLIIDIPLA